MLTTPVARIAAGARLFRYFPQQHHSGVNAWIQPPLILINQFVPLANRPDGTFQTVSGIHKDRTDQFTAETRSSA